MKKYTYSIQINKPADFIFEKLQEKSIYAQWAKPWGEGMTFTGEWKQGDHLIFHDDKGGTKAEILEMQEPDFIKMKHVAMVDAEGNELEPSDEAMRKWIGSLEDYYFRQDDNGVTTFEVVVETDEMFEEMGQAWPIALQLFKEICEA